MHNAQQYTIIYNQHTDLSTHYRNTKSAQPTHQKIENKEATSQNTPLSLLTEPHAINPLNKQDTQTCAPTLQHCKHNTHTYTVLLTPKHLGLQDANTHARSLREIHHLKKDKLASCRDPSPPCAPCAPCADPTNTHPYHVRDLPPQPF